MAVTPDAEHGSKGQRVWGGTTLAERRTFRRAMLLDTALDLIGEEGTAGVTMRLLCRRAGLTDRYFYESFEGRDQLLRELYQQVADEVRDAVEDATTNAGSDTYDQSRAAIEVFVGLTIDDPRKGRLLMVEALSEPALGGLSIAIVPAFTKLLRKQLPDGAGRSKRAMTAIGIAGALAALFSSWLSGTLKVTREELIDHCVGILVSASATGPAYQK